MHPPSPRATHQRPGLWLAWLTLAWLFVAVAPASARAAHPSTPEQEFVHSIMESALETTREKDSPEQARQTLQRLFNENVAIDWVGRFVLGRHWRQASPDQRQAFIRHYRDFMVSNYAKRLAQHIADHYEISKPQSLGNNKHSLQVTVYRPKGKEPVQIQYKIRGTPEKGYKIYDLVVEGISLITSQRSEFNTIINRQSLDYLIRALEKKAQKRRNS